MPNATDLTGKRVARLTVVRFAGTRRSKSGESSRWWLCRCDCGGELEVRAAALLTVVRDPDSPKGTRSCGCLYRERIDSHADSLRKLPVAGEGSEPMAAADAAAAFGVSRSVSYQMAPRLRPRNRQPPPRGELLAAIAACSTLAELVGRLGVAKPTVYRWLREEGIDYRTVAKQGGNR